MSLQYALFQVMRLLTDKAVDTKRVALMLYALQIAASNLKRLHEETQEITKSGDLAQEKSLMKELLEILQIPETEAECMAEESAAEQERENASSHTHTIKACADDTGEPTANSKEVSFRARMRRQTRAPGFGGTGCLRASESRNLLFNSTHALLKQIPRSARNDTSLGVGWNLNPENCCLPSSPSPHAWAAAGWLRG